MKNMAMNNLPAPGTENIHDLGLAACLVSLNYEIVNTDKDYRGRVSFCFIQSQKLELAISDYWSNKLSVPARIYFDNIKMLKSRIYNG